MSFVLESGLGWLKDSQETRLFLPARAMIKGIWAAEIQAA